MSVPQFHFRSSLFHASQIRPGWPASLAYGEDLAEWLRARLQCEGYELSRPRWDGGWWELECRDGETRHWIRVRRTESGAWVIVLKRARSWLASLVLPARAACRDLAQAVHAMLLREPAVRELRWDDARAAQRAQCAP